MAATEVWAVTSGSYSDYHVDVLFSTKELAEAFIAQRTQSTKDEKWVVPNLELHNEEPERFVVWDALPGPDELRWHAKAVIENGCIKDRSEWSEPTPVWENDWDDEVTLWRDGCSIRVVRRTKEEAVQRVSEWVAEQMSAEHNLGV